MSAQTIDQIKEVVASAGTPLILLFAPVIAITIVVALLALIGPFLNPRAQTFISQSMMPLLLDLVHVLKPGRPKRNKRR